MPEAARITDRIGHVSIWARLARVALRVGSSLVEGLAVAAVITLAVGGSVATMGCGAIIAVFDQHIAHVEERIQELAQLKLQLNTLRQRCRTEQAVDACGILHGLAAMENGQKSERHTHLG